MMKGKLEIIKFSLFISIIIFIILYINKAGLIHKLDPDYIKSVIESYGSSGPLIFIFIYIFATILLFPNIPFTIASGFLFDTFFGTVYAVIGATIGASLAFLLSRLLGGDFVSIFISERFGRIKILNEKIKKNGFMVVVLLRLFPFSPFNLLNFLFGLTKIKFKDYVIGTMLGAIPISFVYSNIGSSLKDVESPEFLLALGLLMLFLIMSILYIIYKKHKYNKHK